MDRRLLLPIMIGLFAPASALAEDWRWAGRFLAASEIVNAKGVGLTDRDPGVLLRVERRGEGAYVGGLMMTENGWDDREIEAEILAGITRSIGPYGIDASAYYKYSTGMSAGRDRDMFEYRLDLTRHQGRASGRLRLDYTPDLQGRPDAAWWVEGQGGWRVSTRATVSGAIGRRTLAGGRDSITGTWASTGVSRRP
ncbi:hypothetical protein ABOZ73_18790 [Caulobacter sp. 73W]|uniref:DUF2490 domain-containing protein n=1 Tax=Caulobacter sp. 73W TaxID=3161137 RepID=A0AB39KSC3_9CAUL